jgi:hypothetical protein
MLYNLPFNYILHSEKMTYDMAIVYLDSYFSSDDCGVRALGRQAWHAVYYISSFSIVSAEAVYFVVGGHFVSFG